MALVPVPILTNIREQLISSNYANIDLPLNLCILRTTLGNIREQLISSNYANIDLPLNLCILRTTLGN